MTTLREASIAIKLEALQYREGLKATVLETRARMEQMKESALGAKLANQGLAKSNDEVSGSFQKLGSQLANKIITLTAYYVLVRQLIQVIGGGISELRGFDEALRNIQSITLESDDSLRSLGQELLALVFAGKSAGASATEVAQAMYELVSAGYSSGEALQLAQISAVGAAAGLANLADTSKLLLGILQAYHLPVSDAQEVMNQLFTIVDLGVVHFKDLTENMGYLIPTAAALGIPLEQVGAAIELLTREGQTSSRVFTNLNDVMTRLLKPNKELLDTIQDLGYASGSAMVNALGFAGTVEKLSIAASDNSKEMKDAARSVEKESIAQREAAFAVQEATDKLRDQTEAQEKLRISQEEATLALADSKDRVTESKLALDDAKEAASKHFKTTRERTEAQLHLNRAQRDYEKSQIEVRNSELRVKDAQDAVNKSSRDYEKAQLDVQKAQLGAQTATNGYTQALKDLSFAGLDMADDKLARWFGDVRAIRAILPLAAHDGRDLNEMLVEHARVASEGNRQDQAFTKQKEAFNQQLRMGTANLKAFAVVMIGPAREAITIVLKLFNDIFKPLSRWDEAQQKFVLDQGKLAAAVKTAWAIIVTIFGAVTAFFTAGLAIIPFAIIAILIETGNLGKALQILRDIGVAAFNTLKSAIIDFSHFFILALQGGSIGGAHSGFERFAFNLGQAVKDSLPHIKAFAAEMLVLAHLFAVGFTGGSIGGEFSGLEKAAFRAGQVVHQVFEFIKDTAAPFALKLIVQVVESIVKNFEAAKQSIEKLVESPSFKAFIKFLKDNLVEYAAHIVDLGVKIGNFLVGLDKFLGSPVMKFLTGGGLTNLIAEGILVATGIGNFIGLIQTISDVFQVIDKLIDLFHKVVDAVDDAWHAVGRFIDEIGSKASQAFNSGKDIGSHFVNGLVEGLKGVASQIGNIASSIEQGLKKAFNEALKWAHDNLKVHIGKIGTGKLAVDLGDLQFPLVQLARGVRDWMMGGLALLGENGPELAVLPGGTSVAPAGATSRILDNLSSGGSNRGDTTVYADFHIQAETFDEIKRKLHAEVENLDRETRYRVLRGGVSIGSSISLKPGFM